MAAQIVKRKESTNIDDNTQTVIEWKVWDTFSKDEATALLLSTTPAGFDNLILKGVTVEGTEHKDIWECTATYGLLAPLSGDLASETQTRFNFNISFASVKITQSKETVFSKSVDDPDPAPDHKGAIGFNDGMVEGVNIRVPVYSWQETHSIPVSSVTQAYINTLKLIADSPVNDNTFRGSAAGEIMFVGVTGTQKDQNDFELVFTFEESKNATDLTVGDIEEIPKAGNDYLWTQYETIVDAGSDTTVKQPKAVYVEKVYDRSDFADLGIGTGPLGVP